MSNSISTNPGKTWSNLKIEILDTWSGISSDEIERTQGSVQAIYGLVQQKTGLHKDIEKAKLVAMLENYESL
ncbi:hypothetical protein D3C72_2441560 [compost metagenome]